jgi:hypothetical protein
MPCRPGVISTWPAGRSWSETPRKGAVTVDPNHPSYLVLCFNVDGTVGNSDNDGSSRRNPVGRGASALTGGRSSSNASIRPLMCFRARCSRWSHHTRGPTSPAVGADHRHPHTDYQTRLRVLTRWDTPASKRSVDFGPPLPDTEGRYRISDHDHPERANTPLLRRFIRRHSGRTAREPSRWSRPSGRG